MSVKDIHAVTGAFGFSGKYIARRLLDRSSRNSKPITIFMSGDVMTGRGIDQVLPHPGDPLIHEPYMKSAAGYVKIAEEVNGPIQQPVSFSYIWGDALEELDRVAPEVRIINLETSITKSNDYWKGKGINYRMHPENIPSLTAARIDVCSLANNHVLDWGYPGLVETLESLKKANLKTAGAGRNLREAEAAAIVNTGAIIGDMISLGSKHYLPIDLSMRPVLILFTGIHRIMSEQLKFTRIGSFYMAAVTF